MRGLAGLHRQAGVRVPRPDQAPPLEDRPPAELRGQLKLFGERKRDPAGANDERRPGGRAAAEAAAT